MRRRAHVACLLAALVFPMLVAAQSNPPGPQPADTEQYTVEAITGRSGVVVYGLVCKSGTSRCQYDWQTLCGGQPAIDAGWEGYAERSASYSTHLGKAIRLFVCEARARPRHPELEDGVAFAMFMQSISARRGARVCERGIPGYRRQFDDLYARWHAKHRDRILRGEVIYGKALSKKRPSPDYARLQQIEQAIAELGRAPLDTSPVVLDDRRRGDCEETLHDLEVGITQPVFGADP